MFVETAKTEDGNNAYNFTANGTEYTVIEKSDSPLYTVFSERKSASFGLQVKVMTLGEMSKRSKALENLVTLIGYNAMGEA